MPFPVPWSSSNAPSPNRIPDRRLRLIGLALKADPESPFALALPGHGLRTARGSSPLYRAVASRPVRQDRAAAATAELRTVVELARRERLPGHGPLRRARPGDRPPPRVDPDATRSRRTSGASGRRIDGRRRRHDARHRAAASLGKPLAAEVAWFRYMCGAAAHRPGTHLLAAVGMNSLHEVVSSILEPSDGLEPGKVAMEWSGRREFMVERAAVLPGFLQIEGALAGLPEAAR